MKRQFRLLSNTDESARIRRLAAYTLFIAYCLLFWLLAAAPLYKPYVVIGPAEFLAYRLGTGWNQGLTRQKVNDNGTIICFRQGNWHWFFAWHYHLRSK